MKKNFYNIDFVRLCITLIPVRMRGGLLKLFIECFSQELDTMHKEFTAWRNDFFNKLVKTSTVSDLETVLNHLYDPDQCRIKIVDGENTNYHVLLYQRRFYEAGLVEPCITPVMIYKRNHGIDGVGIDFYIKVPLAIYRAYTTDEAFRKDFDEKVSAYKPAGKNYKVVLMDN